MTADAVRPPLFAAKRAGQGGIVDTTPHQFTPEDPEGDSDRVRALGNERRTTINEVTPPAAVGADVLVHNSLVGLAEYQAERTKANTIQHDLESSLTTDQIQNLSMLVEALTDVSMAWASYCVDEVARHLPLVAPTLPHLWGHVVTQTFDQVGRCCTGPRQYPSVPPVPPGVQRRETSTADAPVTLARLVDESNLIAESKAALVEYKRASAQFSESMEDVRRALPDDPDTQILLHDLQHSIDVFTAAETRLERAEIMRHLPGVAQVISILAHSTHVGHFDQIARCCALDEGATDV